MRFDSKELRYLILIIVMVSILSFIVDFDFSPGDATVVTDQLSKEVSTAELPGDYDKSVSVENTNTYFYAGTKQLASKSNDVVEYLYADRMNTNSLSSNGIISKSFPFGQQITIADSGFTGKEIDFTNLHYFNARYYDSDTGKFITVDPLVKEIPYLYVLNNPLKYNDPTGLKARFVYDSEQSKVDAQRYVDSLNNLLGNKLLYLDNHGNLKIKNQVYSGSDSQNRIYGIIKKFIEQRQLTKIYVMKEYPGTGKTNFRGEAVATRSQWEFGLEPLGIISLEPYGSSGDHYEEGFEICVGNPAALFMHEMTHAINNNLEAEAVLTENAVYEALGIDFRRDYYHIAKQNIYLQDSEGNLVTNGLGNRLSDVIVVGKEISFYTPEDYDKVINVQRKSSLGTLADTEDLYSFKALVYFSPTVNVFIFPNMEK